MRKLILTSCVLAFAFLLPFNTFGQGVSNRREVTNEPLFAMYSDLQLVLPEFGITEPVTIPLTVLMIWWTGIETTVTTPSGVHNHQATVESANGTIFLVGAPPSLPPVIPIVVESGLMNEHRSETGVTTVDVSLRVKSVTIGSDEYGPTMLKIQRGQIKFLKLGELQPAPRRSKVHITTLGRIKSGR